jgi:regulator of protease activity HflC (stomatin/prohibitin superfamily)
MRTLKICFYLIVLMTVVTSCTTVPAGYRGIKVYMLGNKKGVETQQLGVGAYFIGPNQRLYTFPVFQQNYVWKDERAEGGADNSITFQSKEGLDVDADFGISYSLVPDSVSAIFQKYRRGIDEITNIFLKNMVRDALNTTASKMPIESIYGVHKKDLLERVDSTVSVQTEKYGIIIDRIYTIGEFRLPKMIETAINEKLQANQKAMQTQNEVKAVEAEANKRIAEAKGMAESKVIQSQADADALRIKSQAEADAIRIKAQADADALRLSGDAQAEANKKLSESLTPDFIKYSTINKWDGKVPQITGQQTTPFINLNAGGNQ